MLRALPSSYKVWIVKHVPLARRLHRRLRTPGPSAHQPVNLLQPLVALEEWHEREDPWSYESSAEDAKRKEVLLTELPDLEYASTLEIGCGQGFLTRDLPGKQVVGIDVSAAAIRRARETADVRISYQEGSIFQLRELFPSRRFDLIVVAGVLYPQYVGRALNLVYDEVREVLAPGGILASVHIDSWYRARFPLLLLKTHFYDYREHTHRLEIYAG